MKTSSKTSSRRVCKTSCNYIVNYVFKTSSNVTLKTSSARLHQDECLLGCCYHVTYEFQSESTLYNLPECQRTILVQIRRHIWSLSGSNEIRTHYHLAGKRTLNHLVKQAERPVCLNSLLFVYELSGCGFESRCYHLTKFKM